MPRLQHVTRNKKNLATLVIIICIVVLVGLAVLAKPFLSLINSRTFQFFGTIVNRVETDKKIVALTFDDGPTDRTADVLALVDDARIPVTFYLIGQELEKRPEVGRRIAKSGHQIGNHSYSHTRMVFKSPWFITHEIDTTSELIRKTGYTGPMTFRPPYGKKLLFLPLYLKLQDIPTIMWDVEPESYPKISSRADTLTDYVIRNTKPGSIILLHPMGKNSETRRALPDIIRKLKQKGYRFVTVSELLNNTK